ncbi:hypothetical protein KY348_00750 [Candidatus Woesearchaeota archaeon]|nr:hypothetical protein [Candidatus Woesearchaeota archaeon]
MISWFYVKYITKKIRLKKIDKIRVQPANFNSIAFLGSTLFESEYIWLA